MENLLLDILDYFEDFRVCKFKVLLVRIIRKRRIKKREVKTEGCPVSPGRGDIGGCGGGD